MNKTLTITNWDRAYKQGKYDQEGPIPLVRDIVDVLQHRGLAMKPGFYPGAGNGRNFVPLFDAGLRLEGNDISPIAVKQLKQRRPEANVAVGDFLSHKPGNLYWYLLSIQLFQHGDRFTIKQLFDKAWSLIQPGGLFVLRVNSIHTQIVQEHVIVERTPQGGFTAKYHTGQKAGMLVHFYSAEEIRELTAHSYQVVMPLREEFMPRDDGSYWVQWETILQKAL